MADPCADEVFQRGGANLKRTPLKRTQPLRRTTGEARASLKVRKCPVKKGGCGSYFVPEREKQIACLGCAASVGAWLNKSKAQKEAIAAAKQERKETNARKEAAKTLPTLKKEAQEAVNRYVRLRDAGKGCFVCGVPLQLGGVGGGFDAGHIRSRSNADHLRYDMRNIHGQCKPCNRPGSTKDHEMKAAAIRLLGKEEAEALYDDNRNIKWKRDQVREIRDTYRARARGLEAQCSGV
jgi:predicted Fe-S protein YdhL (DUF1289 family)